MTGREAMGLRAIREELTEYNALSDGPCGVVVKWNDQDERIRVASVVCAEFEEAVVEIPGDDRPFPLASFAEALACSEVLGRP